MELATINQKFTYHPPKKDQPERYEKIRAGGKAFAQLVNSLCPDSQEQEYAILLIETAVVYANTAIARNE